MAGWLPAESGDLTRVLTASSYLDRKRREIALLNRCLASGLDLPAPRSPAEAIEQKFRIAAALRAEQSLASWAVTETARPPTQRWRSGAYEFDFGYQRADLVVRGPPIYAGALRQTVIYTSSGMSAIAALVVALLEMHEPIDVWAAADCYGETRELMQRFGARLRIVTPGRRVGNSRCEASLRVLWLDSAVHARFFALDSSLRGFDLIVVDSSCFAVTSGKIRNAIDRAAAAGVPVALLRSHAKLDCLGIEYGRLGSIVFVATRESVQAERIAWTSRLASRVRDAVRLFGLAPIPVHFPPFAGTSEYRACSVARVTSIIRNTRRLVRILEARLQGAPAVATFQHGLYLTLAPGGDPDIDDVKRSAGNLAADVAAKKLCVKHAGSFGFDFVAVEWFPDPLRRRNVMRIAGADLPSELTDRIAEAIAKWWSGNRRVHGPVDSHFARVGEAIA